MANIFTQAFYSLGKKINKFGGEEPKDTEEGIVSEKFPELKLDLPNEDILKLTQKWERAWTSSKVYADWIKNGEENEKYWLGKQFDVVGGQRPMIDNIIFESLETYLPQVTRRNPDPMVKLAAGIEESEENRKFATDLQKELGDLADELKFRLKLKKVARHWAIYLLGVAKLGWDMNRDIPTVKIVRGKKLILDPDAITDEDGYSGEFIGEYRKMQASIMIQVLENMDAEQGAVQIIKDLVGDNLGTEVQFQEWWTDEYMCWKLGSNILYKSKNPHWNYDSEAEKENVDAYGETTTITESVPGINHFPIPKKPYLFLTVFNLGKQPVDETSLITQNLSNQDLINKRVRQIDKNADSMNGGMVVSLSRSGLTKDQARGVTEALRKGGTIAIPDGSVNDAIVRMSAPELPITVYNQLQDTRNRLRDVFGTRGSTPAGLETETTVRGKVMNRTLDTDRIGGGFSEYLEQFADDIYNWFAQLLYVYDERYMGKELPKIVIGVKEGSLLPKDSTTIANQAIELANAGKMSLLDLYKRLDYPNPEELATNVWLETNAPEMLYNDPRIQQVMQARQAAAQGKPPSASISFKDLPPEGQAQLAKQAGIELDPEAIAAFIEFNDQREQEKKRAIPEVKDNNQITQ